MFEIILEIIVSVFVGLIFIELYLREKIFFVRKNFPWLITKNDEIPKLENKGLEKFFCHGFDSELGWIRKPLTNHEENGRDGKTHWHIDENGSRVNDNKFSTDNVISCYGDSFTFGRQVNDNETWEYYLSQLLKTNIKNFGVGNYGLDQTLLRLKREFPKNKTNIVLIGVVPDTISRIMSVWKHYYEYGNTFGFKPRFIILDNKLKLIHNFIDSKEKFSYYQKFLSEIQKNDFFYEKKFKKEILKFPYLISFTRNFSRNYQIIKWVTLIEKRKSQKKDYLDILWNPMKIIMKINLEWRIKLFKNQDVTQLLEKIINEIIDFSNRENFIPIFIWLPQKDDIIFIKKKYHYFEKFNKNIKNFEKLRFIDITKYLLQEKNIDNLFSDNNEYGGHYSKLGNQKISQIIFSELNKMKILSDQ